MADRDKISSNIHPLYRNICNQIFEAQSPLAIAESVLRPLREDVKTLGSAPVKLIRQAITRLKSILELPMFKMMADWDGEHQNIDELIRKIKGTRDGLEWAGMACHQVLSRLETGEQIQDIGLEMYKQYILNIYKARVEEGIPPTNADLDYETIEKHLALIRPHVEEEIKHLAHQLARHKNINSLHLPDRSKPLEDILHSSLDEI